MSGAVTVYEASSLPERARYAQTLADAADLIPRGLFDNKTGRPSPAKILLVMETGAMLGLHPMAALQGIDVIEGKATISPQLMTGLIRTAGHRLVIEKSGSIVGGDYRVTVTGTRADTGDVFADTWDLDRAQRAGLCRIVRDDKTGRFKVEARSEKGKPLPWEKYPELVCVWRAVGVVGREGFDDVLKGLSYTPEELGAVVDESGVVEAQAEPSEDWQAVIGACATKEEVKAVVDRAKEAGEFTDQVRTAALTRYGMLGRAGAQEAQQEAMQTAEVIVTEAEPEVESEAAESDEDAELAAYEAQTALDFEAAQEAGEVQP